jgi:opacity protein-like surface antigen
MKKIIQAALLATLALSCAAQAVVVRGYGTSALKGGDLTDPENNGNPEADINYNATFRSSVESYFGGGEGAFNVFDNRVGGGNDKWCCDTGNVWVEAAFTKRYVLTGFTATSGNDSPDRDSNHWKILGSNDGVNYTAIFSYDSVNSPWANRMQVNEYVAGVDFSTPAAYSIFRYQSTGTVQPWMHQLNELEFFGKELPEPGVLGLVGLGLAGMLAGRRRRAVVR